MRGRGAGLVGAAALVALACAAIEPPYPVRGAPPRSAEERRVAQAARRVVVGPRVDGPAWRALAAAAADEVSQLDVVTLSAPYADDRAAVLALARASEGAVTATAAREADAAARQLRARYGAPTSPRPSELAR